MLRVDRRRNNHSSRSCTHELLAGSLYALALSSSAIFSAPLLLCRFLISAVANAALNATVSSGIRSFYCYCPTLRVRAWEPFEVDPNILPDWVMQGLETLAEAQPFGNGRVRLGFAFDGLFLPKWMVVDLFDKVRALGIKLITTHDASGAIFGMHVVRCICIPPERLPTKHR